MSSGASKIGTSLIWSTASSLGTQALSFLTFAILARILGAQAFGLVALAALVIDLLLIVSNAGMSEAVVQKNTLTEDDADTAFWTNLICGLFFCGVTIAAAPLIARLFNQPRLDLIIKALASIFAITPFGAIHTARLTRELQFKSVAFRNVVASLVGSIVGLPLALAGYGVWALVFQRIAIALGLAITALVGMPWRPRIRFHWRSCQEMLRFGGYIGISTTLNQINIRSTEIISGALAGPAAVAFIRAGSRIVEVLNQITYAPFQQITMPLLARSIHLKADVSKTYLQLSRLSAFIMFPAFMGCFALADPIVRLVFGPGWESVADALKIFACAVFASQMNNLIIAAITAAGASRTVLSWTTAQIILGASAAFAVSSWGWQAMLIVGVLRGYLILPYGFILLHRHLEIGFGEILQTLRPALTSTLAMTLIVTIFITLSHHNLNETFIIIIGINIGAAAYLTIYCSQDSKIIPQIRLLLTRRFSL